MLKQGEGGAGSLRRDWGEVAGNSKVEIVEIVVMVAMIVVMVVIVIIMVMFVEIHICMVSGTGCNGYSYCWMIEKNFFPFRD